MNTSSTKTRALCVATRCTSVEQFVATFHRFCGDDETFFVATMTSRPIGLETPFSIQLADKQPVLRGLCIVLDAWETPENRYRRPGIRLGIKRLTADSQVIYDRLKAASRTPGTGEASSGPAPQPQLAAGSQPPGTMRRPVTPPPLPPLLPPRTTPPAVPAIPREAAPPLAVVRVPPLGAAPPTTAPRLSREPSNGSPPRGVTARPASSSAPPAPALPSVMPRIGDTKPGLPVTARPALPSVVPVSTRPTLPGVAPASAPPASPSAALASAPPALPSAVPVSTRPTWPGVAPASAPPASPSAAPASAPPVPPAATRAPGAPAQGAGTAAAESPPAARAPIAVTRFQFALRVDTTPPPLTDVEFKPTELVPRKRLDRIIGEPSPSEAQIDDALPAVIIDRPSGPVEPDPAAPSFAPYENTSPTVDPLADRRTPGSSLVLPANPLQDLSDESIEGFVDCTIYEETENIFHPGVDGAEWADVTDPEQPLPSALLALRAMPRRLSPPPMAVPAMPFDTPPNLTVRAQDDRESLAVGPDDPALSRAVAGELGRASLVAAADPAPMRASSGPLGVPSAEIIDDPPPSPPAVIVDDPALSRAMADEISRRAAADDPSQSRTASGELWSETLRRTPSDGLPRTQPRPDTPLPRPATNVPMDLGDSPDPASWFDSVSLPHTGAAPRPAMTMAAALAPPADPAFAPPAESALAPVLTDPALAPMPPAAGFAPAVAMDPSLLPAARPGPGFAPGTPQAPGFAPGYGFAPGMPPGPGPDPAYMPGPFDPAMQPAMPPMFGPLESGPVGPPGYPVDGAPYPRYSAADLVALPGMPVARAQPPWQRWLLIAGSAVVAIIVAFLVARLARGSDRAAPAGAGAPASAPARAVVPRTAPPLALVPGGPAAARAARPAGSAAAGDPDGTAGDGEPPAGEATDEDGEAAAGGTPVVGSGPCRFTVATTPAGAVVRLDDQPMGPSPITIEGSCDKHKVDVAHVRYQSVTRWVTPSADKPQELDISLPRPIHAVTVTSSPPGAELSIDGHRAGTTPTVVQMTGFATVNLTFAKPGFQPVTRKVYSKVAQDRVFVKLAK